MEAKEKAKLNQLIMMLETNKVINSVYETNTKNLYNENEIYDQIEKIYFKDEKNERKSKEELYDWAKEKVRYSILNVLIELACNLLHKEKINGKIIDNPDLFFANNWEKLINIMLSQGIICTTSTDSINIKLPKLDENQIDRYVLEILSECDPTLEWVNEYNKLKEEKRIIDSNEEKGILAHKLQTKDFDGKFENAYIKSSEGIDYILLTHDGTLEDIPSTIHEFAHYISEKGRSNQKIPKTFQEFPSIFYELYSLEFLKKAGYNDVVIKSIREKRLQNTMDHVLLNYDMLRYLRMYLEYGEIKEEEDIKYQKDLQERIKGFFPQLSKYSNFLNYFLNYKKRAFDSCDDCIRDLILNPWCLYDIYPYIIGTFLAVKSMESLILDENLLHQIKDYTENLAFVDPYEVFKSIGYDIKGDTLK